MRGTHGSYKQPFSAAGIIPAYAGNTSTPAIHTDCGGGIIPAYAGNTFFPDKRKGVNRDHPRVCGEHHLVNTRTKHGEGSSPRMRGTLDRICIGRESVGIIPAYAGNTHYDVPLEPEFGDHPRVCGEHEIVDSQINIG